jgi:ribosomal protein S18 acetylase RimI-like enzyme
MSLVRILEWDSRFFHTPIGRIEISASSLSPDAITAALREAKGLKLACLYFQVPFTSPEITAFCSRQNFLLVDFKTVLSKPLDDRAFPEEAGDGIVSPEETHYPVLEKIVESLARTSRFRFDPHFGEEGANRLYRTWLRKSFSEGFSSDFLVAHRDGRPEGFLTLRPRDGVPHIDLLGVAEEARGRGVGGRLIRCAESRLRAQGAGRVDVITQGHNIDALRVYQKSGFLIASSDIFFHIWLEELD